MGATRFVSDGMLGSLARKLRIYGFDVLYHPSYLDQTILKVAKREGRVILTSDRELHANALKQRSRSILLVAPDDEERLVAVMRETGETARLLQSISRCAVCNGELEKVTRSKEKSGLPVQVRRSGKDVFRCVACGKFYWVGSHWKRIDMLSRRVLARAGAGAK